MNILTTPNFQEVKTVRELPSSPGVVRHIMKIAQKEDVTAEEIIRIVKVDPALAARVVKAANMGPAHGVRPVVAIPDAVAMLGLRQVRQLALGFSLLSSHSGAACRNFDHESYWKMSLATAIAFSAIANRLQTAPPEEAFATGLLSRIGTLALATIYTREYDDMLAAAKARPETSLGTLEREAFATDHNEFGASLLLEWGIPRPLVEAVYHHEAPQSSGFAEDSRGFRTTHALHFAHALAKRCVSAAADEADGDRALRHLARELGIGDDVFAALLDETAAEWQRCLPYLIDPESDKAAAEAEPDFMPVVSAKSAPTGLKLLIADDDAAIAGYLSSTLAAAGHEVYTAANGQQALELALRKSPHVIITDWLMPEMDGVSLCKALRQTVVGRNVYVLVMTDSQDVGRLIAAFDAGADDYVHKPVSPKVLMARLRAAQRVLHLHAEFERDREEMRRVAAELAIENRRYKQAALTDPLTGFPNRRYALEKLAQEWAAASRTGRPFACLLIGVDHFKAANDTYGHDAGNAVLKATAQILRSTARGRDAISHLGGEEFLMVCPNTSAKGAQVCAERLRAAVEAAHITAGSLNLSVTVSIGVAVWRNSIASPEALIKAADVSLDAAKEGGRNRVSFIAASRPAKKAEEPPAAVEQLLPVPAR